MNIIDAILNRPEFTKCPPVLVDVGASGGLNPGWGDLAKYSICLAFDPDEREMSLTRKHSKWYKELYVFNRALTSGPEGAAEFYLTNAPPCSSLLRPNTEKLSAWEFADRFGVVKKSQILTMHLTSALRDSHNDRVDWFKTDSQGTDLRLFLSLDPHIRQKVLVAEFEPGILDAYEGEDKLWKVLSRMDELGFWMSDMAIHGSSRIRKGMLTGFSPFERTYMMNLLKTAPGWAEVTYLNSFIGDAFSKRDYLLGWVCASIKQQHGFALELAAAGHGHFEDSIFQSLKENSLRSIRGSYFRLQAYLPLLRRAFRKWRKLGTAQFVGSATTESEHRQCS